MTAVFGNLQTKNPPALADEVNAGGFCMLPGLRNVKIKSGTSFSRYAALYKSPSFSSGSILAGVYVSVKPFWYSAPQS